MEAGRKTVEAGRRHRGGCCDATECASKRPKPYEFRRKGHEDQFNFNDQINDRIATALKKLSKLAPAAEKDKMTLQRCSAN